MRCFLLNIGMEGRIGNLRDTAWVRAAIIADRSGATPGAPPRVRPNAFASAVQCSTQELGRPNAALPVDSPPTELDNVRRAVARGASRSRFLSGTFWR